MNQQTHRARKRFGQNFLQDAGIIQRIVSTIASDAARLSREQKHFVEIGPGLGALTQALINHVRADLHNDLHDNLHNSDANDDWRLTLIELDRDLASRLIDKHEDDTAIDVIQQDALSFDFASISADSTSNRDKQSPPLQLFGNLPYNISTPLIFHLLESNRAFCETRNQPIFGSMIFMLQKEVVDRLCAVPGNKTYGRISVMTQYHCVAEHLFDVPPEAFDPRPKVTSAMVRLTPHVQPLLKANDERLLSQLVQQAFAQRRKTLSNNLKKMISADAIRALDIEPSRRAETLSVEEFVTLSNAL